MLKPKTKNLLRALQDRTHNQSQITAHNNLRKATTPDEAAYIEMVLRDSALYSHLSLPPEFPKSAPNFEKYIRLALRPTESEFAALSARVEKHHSKITSALTSLKAIDYSITEGAYDRASDLIKIFHEEYGYSFALLRRVAYVANNSHAESEASAYCMNYLRDSGLERRNLVVLNLLDTMGETYDLFAIKKGVHLLKSRRGERQFTVDITRFVHSPVPSSTESFTSTLQSFLQYSLLDAVIYFCINAFNISTIPQSQKASPYTVRLSKLLQDDWQKLFHEHEINLYIDLEDDSSFYRRSIAWIEYRSVTKFRQAVDPFFVDVDMRAEGGFKRTQERAEFLEQYFSPLSQIQDLLVPEDNSAMSLGVYVPIHAGTFTRTIGFLHLLEVNDGDLAVTPGELLRLMNRTRDLVHIGVVAELARARIHAGTAVG